MVLAVTQEQTVEEDISLRWREWKKNKEHSMRVFVSEKKRARLLLKRESETEKEREAEGALRARMGG